MKIETKKIFKRLGTNTLTMAIVFIAMLGIGAALTLDGTSDNIDTTTINDVNFNYAMKQPYDYIVWQSGATFYVKNGNTGKVDYTSNDKYTAINWAINTIDGGESNTQGTVYVRELSIISANIKDTLLVCPNVNIVNTINGVTHYYGLYGHGNGSDGVTGDHPALVLDGVTNTSKPIIEWRIANGTAVAWVIAHDMLHEDGVYKSHKHISIETANAAQDAIYTRFSIDWGKDRPDIKVVNANFYTDDEGLGFWRDRDTYVGRTTTDTINITVGGVKRFEVSPTQIMFRDSLIPYQSGSYNLGSSALKMNNIYSNNMHVKILNLTSDGQINMPTTRLTSGRQEGTMYWNTTYNVLVAYDGAGAKWVYAGNGSAFP